MIAPWLRQHLEQTGRWNHDGISRNLSAGQCRTCHQPVLRGLDSDRLGIPATVDPQPVDELGEALALLTGRATYDLIRTAGRVHLNHRDRWQLRGPRRHPVHPTHLCHQPLPPQPSTTPDPAPARIWTREEPCF